MVRGADPQGAEVALRRVSDAARELEDARAVLLLRARLALEAGVDERAVCAAAGITPRTLRTWLMGRRVVRNREG